MAPMARRGSATTPVALLRPGADAVAVVAKYSYS